MRRLLLPAVAGLLLALPATAAAHVSVEPETAAAGTEITATFRVPNERDGDPTVKVDLQLPEGVTGVAPQEVDGWQTSIDGRTVTWTGGRIEGEDARRFPVRLTLPDDEGAKLTFKALQTYDSGTVVRWIGDAASDKPAPVLTTTAGVADEAAAPEPTATATPEATVTPDQITEADPEAASDEDEDDGGNAAVIAGAIAALVVVGALVVLARRRRTQP